MANPYNDNRGKINLVDVFGTNMIQFRMKESSTDSVRVNNWLKLLLKFVDNCRKRDYPKAFSAKRNIKFKVEKFFEWFVQDRYLINYWDKEVWKMNVVQDRKPNLSPKFSKISLNSNNQRYNIQN